MKAHAEGSINVEGTRHKALAGERESFPCALCDKKYSQKCHLNKHVKTRHSKEDKIKYEEKEEKMKYEDDSEGDEPLSLI